MLTDGIDMNTDWAKSSDRSVTNVARLAKLINKLLPFARDNGGNIYYFKNGVYNPNGEQAVEEMYIKLLDSWAEADEWRATKGKEIVKYISVTAPILWDRPLLHVINLKNGLYHWETGQLLPHSPEHLSLVQIPITYNPDATCPAWDKFLSEVLPGGENFLREIIGLCMIPLTDLQKCIILVGSGSNGKSTYLNALQAAIGKDNCSNIALHTLTNPMEKFSRSGLVGKLVNIFGDLSNKKIEEAANFKPLVGQDTLTIEYKHKHAFSYTPFCRLIFSTNFPLKSDDDSDGYKRRFIHVPFVQRFTVDPAKGQDLAEELSNPWELSGLFNAIRPQFEKIVTHGFSITPQIAAIIEDWAVMPDETKEWLLENLTYDPNGILPSRRFYDYYCQKAPNPTSEGYNRKNLITYIKMLFPLVECNVPSRVNNHTVRCYRGITVKDPAVREWINSTIIMTFEHEEA